MAEAVLHDLSVLLCTACGTHQLPPKAACRHCGEPTLKEVRIVSAGTVHTFTVIRVPPQNFRDEAPYVVLVAKMAGGIKLVGRLEGSQEGVAIDQPVRLVRRDGVGYWFQRG